MPNGCRPRCSDASHPWTPGQVSSHVAKSWASSATTPAQPSEPSTLLFAQSRAPSHSRDATKTNVFVAL